jgi:adenosine deaminase
VPVPISIESIRSAPKALLHDHLDGGVRPQTILEIAEEIGWTQRLPSTDPSALHAHFIAGAESRDLLRYLAVFEHTLAVMQRAQDIERVAYEAGTDLSLDGVRYAEIRFAPELHVDGGLSLDDVMECVQAGLRRAMRDAADAARPITINTIVCAMRTAQRSREIADLAVRWRDLDPRVVAFDIAGAETGWPPSLHAEAFAHARRHHLHLTVHASEPPDLELIGDALFQGAERIGHGVRLRADVDLAGGRLGPLARHVLERQITLELAPTCNVQIGAVPALADHPIGPFLRLGFRVGVNTDNRLMSKVSMTSEVHAVADTFDLSWSEIAKLATNALDGSFTEWDERCALLREVRAAYAALDAAP